jgi:hypothetical protein
MNKIQQIKLILVKKFSLKVFFLMIRYVLLIKRIEKQFRKKQSHSFETKRLSIAEKFVIDMLINEKKDAFYYFNDADF